MASGGVLRSAGIAAAMLAVAAAAGAQDPSTFSGQALATGSGQALATGSGQGYPARPVRLIIDFPVGGPSDVLGRTIAQKLTDALGQQVVSDNRPGASGALAYGLAAKAPADGYTLVWLSTPFPLNAALRGKLPYDTFKDFAPIALVATYDNVLIVHAGVPAKSVQEFIAYARSKGGSMPYASSGSGSVQHLAMESFRHLAGFQAVHVPYAGSAPALLKLTDVRERIEAFGGQVHYSPPEAFANFIRDEYDRWGPVIKQAGVKLGD